MSQILSYHEWLRSNNECKFKHIYEDQSECLSCELSFDSDYSIDCPVNRKKYKEYKKSFTNNKALFVMMKNQ